MKSTFDHFESDSNVSTIDYTSSTQLSEKYSRRPTTRSSTLSETTSYSYTFSSAEDRKESSSEDIHELPLLSFRVAIVAGVTSQLILGSYYPALRYLQVNGDLDPFVLLCSMMIAPSLVFGFFGYEDNIRSLFNIQRLWFYWAIVICDQIFVVFATRFTYSIYVQLIALSAPFIVSAITRIVYKRKIPKYTVLAVILSVAGAALTLFGDIMKDIESFSIGKTDLLGLGLAISATTALAVWFVFVDVVDELPSTAVLMFQFCLPVCITSGIISAAIGENWSTILHLSWNHWLVLCSSTVFIWIVATYIQLLAISSVGAPLVTTLLPLRLVSATLIGLSPFLNEILSVLNIVGILIVVVTLAIYLGAQYYITTCKRQAQLSVDLYDQRQK